MIKSARSGGFFFVLILVLSILCPSACYASKGPSEVVFACYNVENYGLVNSTSARAKSVESRDAVVAVVAAVHPSILGLCEVSSLAALEDLQERLRLQGIALPHAEFVSGPDPDRHLALLSKFPFSQRLSSPRVGFDLNGVPELVRRGFLDVTVQISAEYALRLVGGHLKSRITAVGGEAQLRRMEAQMLRNRIDEIIQSDSAVNLLVYGDFNDTKEAPSIRCLLGQRGALNSLTDLPAEDANGDRWTYYRNFTDVYERIDYLMVNRGLRQELVPRGARISNSPSWRKASDHRLIYATLVPVDR